MSPLAGNGHANGNGHTILPNSIAEQQPLLGNGLSPVKRSSWRSRMMRDVRRDWTDLVLLACYVITGLLDSASISTWGSFVSMQTGNTVYIGLGIAAPYESTRWIKSGVSLGFFCLGSVCFSAFHRQFSPRRRWVLCASFAFQTLLIVGAAAIVTLGPREAGIDPKESIRWPVLLPIAMVAFQACGQAVTSRALKFNALTSVVLTSVYCDLFGDAELLSPRNVERNQRAAAPLCVLLGVVIGGLIGHTPLGTPGTLFLAALLKSLVVVAWLVWPADELQL